ncbi:MAG: DUF4292 domain-containing protein [Armatimonadota bacterium]
MKISTAILVFLLTVFLVSVASANTELKNKVAKATQGFNDISLTCKVTRANTAELKKISSDFSKRYEFKSSKVYFKSPDKMKMEGKLGMVKMAIIIDGDRKALLIPSLRYSKKENIKNEPHKRQSDFDIGIFTDSLWRDYLVTDVDTVKGSDGTAYKIVFVRDNAKDKKQICWVDADTFKLTKLERYESDGSMKVRFTYSDHKRIGSVWVPENIDIYNADGKLAASTEYENITVNAGIPDSTFKM